LKVVLATQEMTMDEIAAAMNQALGEQSVKADYLSAQEIDEVKVNKHGLKVDLKEMKSFEIKTNSTDEFFARERKALEKAVGIWHGLGF